MNMIAQINVFYSRLETIPLTSNDIALYFALLQINNKTNWKVEFSVAISVLGLKAGMSKKSVERSRSKLVDYGLIEKRSREGRQSAMYKIVRLYDSQKDSQKEITRHFERHNDSQDVAINKQKKTNTYIKNENRIKQSKYQKKNTSNRFHNHEQRVYDFDAISQRMSNSLDDYASTIDL